MEMGCCPWLGWFKRKKQKGDKNKKFSHSEPRRDSASKKNVDSRTSGKTNAPNRAPTFSYRELAAATNNFRQDSFLGRGGFGAVYKGKLERTGQIVAVKQLDPSGIQGNKEFLVEILMLSLLHHPNLVNMIGYCWEGEHRLLVYEYMPFGSLEDHLFDLTPDKKPIDWRTRMKIAAGAAKGLECLHNANPSVIYRDLKPSNILLDEGFHAKLSDFGLAKFGPADDKSHVSTRVMGTYGYCAPEYALSGRLTMKTDIYSYGIFLLELITGRRAVDEINGRQRHLVQWALPLVKDPKKHFLLADPLLKGEYSVSTMKKALEVVSICLNQNANSRPSSSDLVLAMDYMVSRECEPKGSKNSDVNFIENDHTLTLSPSETTRMLNKEAERDRAVAEAKMWGETWRNKRQQSPQGIPVNKISWVDKIQSS